MSKEIRWAKTHCARMDHGGCTLLVGVKGNEIVEVKGDPEGFLRETGRGEVAVDFLGRCAR